MSEILLAKDHEMNRDMLSRRLARKGYEVKPIEFPRLFAKIEALLPSG